ncbi:hypothetical protein D3C77_752440 [compost metagenome]
MSTPDFDDVAHDAQAQAMTIDLFIKPGSTLENLLALRHRYSRAIIVDNKQVATRLLLNAQTHFAVGPLAGVVE